MAEVNLFVRDCWYVAAWSHELVPGRPLGRSLLGEPVCLFRSAQGDAVALADRCAHRGAPLSKGRIEGDTLRCLYHGMRFDREGRCIEMPGQARPPARACVRACPVVERHRWAWIWMGAPERADPAPIPSTWSLDRADWPYRPGYRRYAAPHLLICDNLLDFSHLGYVHPTTLGGTEQVAGRRPNVVVGPTTAAVRNARRLTSEDKVDALIGSTTTPNCLAMLQVAQESDQLPADNPVAQLGKDVIRRYEQRWGEGSRTTFISNAYDPFLLLDAAVRAAAGQARPGTAAFRASLRDALEATKNFAGTQGIYTLSPSDHVGLDRRSRYMVRIDGGKWRLAP